MISWFHRLAQRLKKSPFVSLSVVMVLLLAVGTMVMGVPQGLTPDETPTSQTVGLPVITAPQAETMTFVAFGDNGSGMLQQQRVAEQLIRTYQKTPYPFVLMLGDNFYPDGNVQKYGEAYFNKPYAPLLKAGVKFKPVLGNHDTLKGYDGDQVRFFKMPGKYYDFVSGPVHFFALDTNRFDAKQRGWLESRLASSRSPWKIVYGHHPVYSSGLHGNSNTLISELKPVLEKYHVQLYLAGHDHDYERFAPVNGVYYLVSGGGGASLRKFRPDPESGSLVRLSVLHFLRFTVKDADLAFEAIGTSGEVLDQGEIPCH